ncbi:MAG: dicarboxylate/amino acid:cation symporter [Burkholderiaceae bacterium]
MTKRLFKSLYLQVVVALILGIAVGHFNPSLGVALKPLGDAFINLIKMLITPIIFCTVTVGIAKMENVKTAGRVGVKTLIYFELITTLAMAIGLIVVNIVRPGDGINADPAAIDTTSLANLTASVKSQGTVDFLTNIIPSSVVDSFAKGNLLQVLLFSILCGISLSLMRHKAVPVTRFLEDFGCMLLGVVNMIMKLAPIGAFGAISFTIGKYGIGTLTQLGLLISCFYITCICFIGIVLGSVCRWSGISLWKFIKYLKEEIFIVLGTASTESVLPRMLEKMEAAGCPKAIVGLVLPTGYSFNLDGAAIYLTMTSMFIAQAMNIHLSLFQQLGLVAILLVTSKGGAGVAGAALIALAATLQATSIIPFAGIALIIGIDRIMNEVRAVTNLIGNAVATVAMSKWEKQLDLKRITAVLDGRLDVQAELGVNSIVGTPHLAPKDYA